MSLYSLHLHETGAYWCGSFRAMASDCEILIEATSKTHAEQLVELLVGEVKRIEEKYSRFRGDNIVYAINHSDGNAIEVDDETAALLDFAHACFRISEGLFDISSGILQEVWRFDGGDQVPTKEKVAAVLRRVGWEKITWNKPLIQLPEGMKIDFGGIGKEYAVDKCIMLAKQYTKVSVLVNLGGDIAVSCAKSDGSPWLIGVQDPNNQGKEKRSVQDYALYEGALATSGDVNRYLLRSGIRYGHILNPNTGWPAIPAPRSVTVAANNCLDAGLLSTLAILHGKDAQAFLKQQQIEHWLVW